jgi:hypothetical protein
MSLPTGVNSTGRIHDECQAQLDVRRPFLGAVLPGSGDLTVVVRPPRWGCGFNIVEVITRYEVRL